MDSDFGRAEFLDLSLTEADPIPMSHDRHGSNQWATPSGSPSGIPLHVGSPECHWHVLWRAGIARSSIELIHVWT